jgi:hypothetical protein
MIAFLFKLLLLYIVAQSVWGFFKLFMFIRALKKNRPKTSHAAKGNGHTIEAEYRVISQKD